MPECPTTPWSLILSCGCLISLLAFVLGALWATVTFKKPFLYSEPHTTAPEKSQLAGEGLNFPGDLAAEAANQLAIIRRRNGGPGGRSVAVGQI